MNNIFVEGLQGSGKTTLLTQLNGLISNLKVYYEGHISPIDLAWCSYMNENDYLEICEKYFEIKSDIEYFTLVEDNKRIVAYTKVLTDIPNFHKSMEDYNIYYGNVDFEYFKKVILSRYSKFNGVGNVFECSLFQNNISTMILFYKMSDEDIINFYDEVFGILKNKYFRLIYLDVENINELIKNTIESRVDIQGRDIWFSLLTQYVEKSPYGLEIQLKGIDCVIGYLERRRNLELEIINIYLKDNNLVLKSKKIDVNKVLEYVL